MTSVTASAVPAEKRRMELRLVIDPAFASLSAGEGPPVGVRIKDISRTGLGVTSPVSVTYGSPVLVTCGQMTITGTVRYCRGLMTGQHSIGIKIERILLQGGKEI
jgi:hypothetical protein